MIDGWEVRTLAQIASAEMDVRCEIHNMIRLQNVSTMRENRITSDEEERQRPRVTTLPPVMVTFLKSTGSKVSSLLKFVLLINPLEKSNMGMPPTFGGSIWDGPVVVTGDFSWILKRVDGDLDIRQIMKGMSKIEYLH